MRPFVPIALALLSFALSGCIGAFQDEPIDPASFALAEAPLSLPTDPYYEAAYQDGVGFHTLHEIWAKMDAIVTAAPEIARIEVVGESNEGRPLRAIVIEDGAVAGEKLTLLYDGGHHANEVEGIEVTLFFADYLVTNYETSAHVRDVLAGKEVWIVPVVNPDGYVVQTRMNANGVNLNRNYDLDWCDPAAYNNCAPSPVGEMLPEYAGTGPFSEPESRAIRDLVYHLGDRLAFYLSHHTDVHCITAPWTAPQPPFPVTAEHRDVFDAVFSWVETRTEYGAGDWTWLTGECMSYSAGGSSMDWVYSAALVPSFTFEVGGSEAREGAGVGKPLTFLEGQMHGDLPHWTRASLPVELFFLENAGELAAWIPEFSEPRLPAE